MFQVVMVHKHIAMLVFKVAVMMVDVLLLVVCYEVFVLVFHVLAKKM